MFKLNGGELEVASRGGNAQHALAMSVLGHGLLRGAGLGGPVGAALNGVKAVSGSAYRVTIPAVLQIACLRRMVSATQV